ncbi:hypothetical protein PHIN3_301 [Sinorhizobium phage phiN3]|uniref:Uncharacterized protein n=1 Tax=Sinorhizobium phage phiN3 TaxID=1647405 RepID=A0A0F6WCW9_9CAUD|nr:hypothetical protein AVT40_gp232 [Sinorhizobium phage phiN3]AKF13564.1 hypothetical protein PHIN3_301 [Sinorhizobium phage phiN3]
MTHFVNSAHRAALEAMSLEQLKTRLSDIEAAGKKAKAAMMTPDGNRVVSLTMFAGRRSDVTAAEAAYNSCRMAWKDVMTVINEREAA